MARLTRSFHPSAPLSFFLVGQFVKFFSVLTARQRVTGDPNYGMLRVCVYVCLIAPFVGARLFALIDLEHHSIIISWTGAVRSAMTTRQTA